MRKTAFTSASSGKLVPTVERQLAFAPSPLPPSIDLAGVAIAMADAMQAVGELKGACRRLQNHTILIAPLQRQEALTSSAMEGTFTTDDRLLLAEAGVEASPDEPTTEVNNYLYALTTSLEMLKTLPLSHRVIKKAHDLLLSGLSSARGARKRPGEYKTEQNWIGGRAIDTARYVPPPPQQTQECMDALEAYLNKEDTYPPAVMDLALVHYQIEAIHPFADGNGRVGRMLISLMAVNSGLLDVPVLYMSPSLEAYKDAYINLMFNVSTRGEWEAWLNFFFYRVSESCRATIETIDRLLLLQERYRSLAVQQGRSTNALQLVDVLFERPALTISEAARTLGVTYPAAKKAVDKLVSAGIIEPLADIYPKLFYSPTILRVARNASDKGRSKEISDA